MLMLLGATVTIWLIQSARNPLAWNIFDLIGPRGRTKVHLSPATVLLRDNGLTKDVQWDEYSLFIKGRRVLLWSGEIHPWRIPVRSQWLDVLQKIKASGMNAISVYSHWGLHNPSPGVFDFTGWQDWQVFLDIAKQVGLWVVFRPGPYINAETTGGGIPGWVLAQTPDDLRSNNTAYFEAWSPYIRHISEIIARNQITEGGPIIAVQAENEFTSNPEEGPSHKRQMMAQLRDAFTKSNVVVPLTHNDAGMNGYFVDGKGSPDIYGFDDYPQGFDCANPLVWKNLTKAYHDYHMKTFPKSPLYIPEAQAGAFDPWGPSAPTYDNCRILTGPSFQNNLYNHMLASNAKMINLYMMYGGTSWGNIPFPGVYTSYDYGSPIRETRALSDKYDHLKLLGLFLRSMPDMYHTDVLENESLLRTGSTSELTVVHLKNPITNAGFYYIRHVNVSTQCVFTFTAPRGLLTESRDSFDYSLKLNTIHQELSLPLFSSLFTLRGRTTDLIMTDISFGDSLITYTSASIFFAGKMADRDVLILYGDMEQAHEAIIHLRGKPRRLTTSPSVSMVRNQYHGIGTAISFLPGIRQVVEVWDTDQQLVLYCDTETAFKLHAPMLQRRNTSDPFATFWNIGSNDTIVVGGPYIVRNATLDDGHLALFGDLEGDTMLQLVGLPQGLNRITWNGIDVGTDFELQEVLSVLTVPLGMVRKSTLLTLPTLENWRYRDSLPEITDSFNYDAWTVAENIVTNSSYKPLFGDGPVLYACDYGFCEGTVIWSGEFVATNEDRAVRMVINGGEAFAASVWLNGHFLKTTYGNSTRNTNIICETDEIFEFPEESLRKGERNVLVILQDNMGMDETGPHYDANQSKSPRGIRGYSLHSGGNFTSWKVQGRLGGYDRFVDRYRGLLNNGGLHGERLGWHLPGFPDEKWESRSLEMGLVDDRAGVGFFRTTFALDLPRDCDISISLEFEDDFPSPYRAFVFVNGWNMGKRIGNLGPQTKFVVHEGILNHHGPNTLAVALWAMERGQGIKPRLRLVLNHKFEGGVGADYEPGPGWADLYH
ncbi:Probable beta-galactosidase A; AltName: Full=Lactase A; Flags: Precursor [Serendipita indica DSM 11827]|nr:Probable beta-galactosidase A; AltName: Full=Lactase A; Flags: Precursor [Serendipita indica DSM 11827]